MSRDTHHHDGLSRRIAIARGDEPADLVLRNGRVVNVFSGDIHEADVAIADGRVIGFGKYRSRADIDVRGGYIAPGFIDGHIHIESTMLTPRELARAVVPAGTTAIVADPHEIANVLGVEGIHYMLRASEGLPLRVFLMLPSCVPVTDMETAGAEVGPFEISALLPHPRVLGLAEMMNYPGVVAGDPKVLAKIRACAHARIDGHAPGLSGMALNAYLAAGIKSDHECVTADEALEKLRAGMHVFIREGSVAKNLDALLPVVRGTNAVRCGLVTDDRHPTDLLREGHVNYLLQRAVALGLSPVTALQLVTINPAKYFFTSDLGAIAPGYHADLVVLDDLRSFQARLVFQDGTVVARDGELVAPLPEPVASPRGTLNVAQMSLERFAVPAAAQEVRVIDVVPGQLLTRKRLEHLPQRDGVVVADPKRDIAKLAVVERHRASGNVGVGFVRGLGLRYGAIASTVAHDSHNLVVAGVDDSDMLTAARTVTAMQGGLVVVRDGEVLASLRLPLAGLMTERPLEEVARATERILEAARALGSRLDDVFMVLSFLALPVIPSLRLTDRGLVDVEAFRIVPLFAGEEAA
jgi:adenine deaminase